MIYLCPIALHFRESVRLMHYAWDIIVYKSLSSNASLCGAKQKMHNNAANDWAEAE